MIDWNKTEQEIGVNVHNYKFSSKVAVVCDGCGKTGHKIIRKCANINGQMAWKCMKCHLKDPTTKKNRADASRRTWRKCRDKIINSIDYQKIADNSVRLWQDPKYRAKIHTPESKQKQATVMKEKWQDDKYRQSMMALYKTDEWRKSRSDIAKKAWQDPQNREHVITHGNTTR